MNATRRRLRVIGLGNPDRGDDGVGAQVVEALRGHLSEGVELQACRGDVLTLIDDWGALDMLVCIDAAASLGTPGQVHRFDLAVDELPRELSFASSHAMGLAEAIALARALGQAPRDIVVYAVEGSGFDVGTPLSAAVDAAIPGLVERVLVELEGFRHHHQENASHA